MSKTNKYYTFIQSLRKKSRVALPFITMLVFCAVMIAYNLTLDTIVNDSRKTDLEIAKSCVMAASDEANNHYQNGDPFIIGLKEFVQACNTGPNVYAELFDDNYRIVQTNNSNDDTISDLDKFTVRYDDDFFKYANSHESGTYTLSFSEGNTIQVYFEWIPSNADANNRYLMVTSKADIFQYNYYPVLLWFSPGIMFVGIILAYLQYFTLKEQRKQIIRES